MRYVRMSTTMIAVHDHLNPTDADWTEYVGAYSEGVREHGVRGLLVISQGGGPNGRQRKQVLAALEDHDDIKTAVCSSSAIPRGITTAIGELRGTLSPRPRSSGWASTHASGRR